MGGHGGLNILPQKRWNVYNWDNRERVRRDEQEAARQQQEEEQQQRDRDAGSRLDKLRTNARDRGTQPSSAHDDGAASQPVAADPAATPAPAPAPAAALATHDQLLDLFDDTKAVALMPSKKHKEREDNKDKELERERRRESRLAKRKQEELGVAEEKYRLGGARSTAQPWYMQSRPEQDADATRHPADATGGGGGGDKKRKKSLEDLRAERLEREESERAKARKLLPGTGNSSGSRKHYNSSFGFGSTRHSLAKRS